MKKTLQSLMTAAMFAAAATTALGTLPENSQAEATETGCSDQHRTVKTQSASFGLNGAFDPVQSPVPVYGPPLFYDGPGDLIRDDNLDARDLSEMKRRLLDDPVYWLHVNIDMDENETFDIEDVKMLRRMLTGKTKEQEEAEERARQSTETTAETTISSTLTTRTTTTMPIYGPPGISAIPEQD